MAVNSYFIGIGLPVTSLHVFELSTFLLLVRKLTIVWLSG